MLAGMNGDLCRDGGVAPRSAEQMLLADDLPCPRCRGVLRPFGNGRTRTVRGIGADTVTVTPRWARCADCRVTQILLPTALTERRAHSTEAIGTAPAEHARGAGQRSIAARFGRPESTVRRWLRGDGHRRAWQGPVGTRFQLRRGCGGARSRPWAKEPINAHTGTAASNRSL